MLASEACSNGILLGFCRAMNKESKTKVSSQLANLFLEPLKCEIKVSFAGMQTALCLGNCIYYTRKA